MNISSIKAGKIILVYKPWGWTSFQVVNKVHWKIKYAFGIKQIKIGHTGTLDPHATGILILCTATKYIRFIQNKEKVYTGVFKVGATTPSYDTKTE